MEMTCLYRDNYYYCYYYFYGSFYCFCFDSNCSC